jgi:hypothetical protein
MADLK